MLEKVFPIKINDNLKLSLLNMDECHEFFKLIDKNRSYLRTWLGWLENSQTLFDLNKFVESSIKDYEDKKSLRAWIRYDEKIVGIIHLAEINWLNRKAMIGYWVSEDHQGKGIATNATKAITHFAFTEWNLNRVEIRCATENTNSQAVPKKLGFREEGIIRDSEWLYDHFVDHIIYSKLAQD